MTDEQIINIWKHERELSECSCSYFVDQVELSLVNETIDLIIRQKAEIERLKNRPYTLQIEVSKKIESQIKSEAVKECLAKVKNYIKTHCNPYGKPDFEYDTSIKILNFIDNLVKEMVGGAE